MTENPNETSLYERIGGDDTIRQVVEEFYARLLSDPDLAPFFAETDMSTLAKMQHEFFAAALGGPVEYSGTALVEVHAGRGIEPRHVSRFLEHLVDVLGERGLDDEDIDGIAARLAIAAQDVMGITAEDG